jgi:hypothetical protein
MNSPMSGSRCQVLVVGILAARCGIPEARDSGTWKGESTSERQKQVRLRSGSWNAFSGRAALTKGAPRVWARPKFANRSRRKAERCTSGFSDLRPAKAEQTLAFARVPYQIDRHAKQLAICLTSSSERAPSNAPI